MIEEILNGVFKWYRFPVSLKAKAALLYFKGFFLRAVKEFLLHKGYEEKPFKRYTSLLFGSISRGKTCYLWLAVDEKGFPVFMHLHY